MKVLKKVLMSCVFLSVAACAQQPVEKGIVLLPSEQTVQKEVVPTQPIKKSTKKLGTYEMTANPYNDQACTDFLKNLKEFENESFMTCEVKLSSKYPQFQNLNWQPVDVEASSDFIKKITWQTAIKGLNAEQIFNNFKKSLDEGKVSARAAFAEDLIPNKENIVLQTYYKVCSNRNNGQNFILTKEGNGIDADAGSFQNTGGDIIKYNNDFYRIYVTYYNEKKEGSIGLNKINYRNILFTGQYPCQYKWTTSK